MLLRRIDAASDEVADGNASKGVSSDGVDDTGTGELESLVGVW